MLGKRVPGTESYLTMREYFGVTLQGLVHSDKNGPREEDIRYILGTGSLNFYKLLHCLRKHSPPSSCDVYSCLHYSFENICCALLQASSSCVEVASMHLRSTNCADCFKKAPISIALRTGLPRYEAAPSCKSTLKGKHRGLLKTNAPTNHLNVAVICSKTTTITNAFTEVEWLPRKSYPPAPGTSIC